MDNTLFDGNGTLCKLSPMLLTRMANIFKLAESANRPLILDTTINLQKTPRSLRKRHGMNCVSRFHTNNANAPYIIDKRSYTTSPHCTNCYEISLKWKRSPWPVYKTLRDRLDERFWLTISETLSIHGLQKYLFVSLITPFTNIQSMMKIPIHQYVLLSHRNLARMGTICKETLHRLFGNVVGYHIHACMMTVRSALNQMLTDCCDQLLTYGYAVCEDTYKCANCTSVIVLSRNMTTICWQAPIVYIRTPNGAYIITRELLLLYCAIFNGNLKYNEGSLNANDTSVGTIDELNTLEITQYLNTNRSITNEVLVLHGNLHKYIMNRDKHSNLDMCGYMHVVILVETYKESKAVNIDVFDNHITNIRYIYSIVSDIIEKRYQMFRCPDPVSTVCQMRY